MDFKTRLRHQAQSVNESLRRILDNQDIEPELKKALSYTLESPGKRIRAVLLLWCCELVSGQINENAQIAAACIEMVHTYSLIHDDLPAMDDDDMRRGQPTCHKAFDEATAILSGDALLTYAFEILSKNITPPDIAVRLIRQLAEDAGPSGMIAGQMADLKAQETEGTQALLEYIHVHKTAKMFRCAAVMGALCANASPEQLDMLNQYGLQIGLAFQIADDILDETASSEQLGKTAGKDFKAAKCTYPSVVGLDNARALLETTTSQAVAALEAFGPKADTLRQLAEVLRERTK